MRGDVNGGRAGWGAAARRLRERAWGSRACRALLVIFLASLGATLADVPLVAAQSAVSSGDAAQHSVRLDGGRFTVVANAEDSRLAQAMLTAAQQNDTFPGLPRPSAHVLIAIAPDAARFRQWVGPTAPEWGAAIALPQEQRIVMQGGRAGSDAGDPRVVLRHELAHLALHETMGDLPPRWFDEGYASVAAHEWTRELSIETSNGLVWRALPTLEKLDDGFESGESQANWSYALAYRVVDEMSALDAQNGLTNFFVYWKRTGAFEPALRRAFAMTGEQFDKHWQHQTRVRFGALAFVTDVSAAIGFFAILLGPLFWMRKRRDRERLEAMRRVDAAQERAEQEREARDRTLQAILGEPESVQPPDTVGTTPSADAAQPS